MVQVKICGICSAGDAQDAVDAGADLLGFHFCSSPRRIEPELARSIVAGLDRRPTIVGVFIDQTAVEVGQIAEYVGLDLLQLHGSEAPGFDAGRPLMKVLKVRGDDVPDASPWPDPLMLDSWSRDQRGGTVSIDMPDAERVSRELLKRDILVDYRPKAGVRMAPHFYNKDDEVEIALAAVDEILKERAVVAK